MTPRVTGCPLNCAPGAGSWEQTIQLLWMMTGRCRPLMSLGAMLVLDGSEATATLRLLPVRSGIAWPSDMGEGDSAPWSAAGHVSSSLTTPKSILLPLPTVLPAVGAWKQTFQSRSRICRRARPLASWLARLEKPAACASSCAVCSPFPTKSGTVLPTGVAPSDGDWLTPALEHAVIQAAAATTSTAIPQLRIHSPDGARRPADRPSSGLKPSDRHEHLGRVQGPAPARLTPDGWCGRPHSPVMCPGMRPVGRIHLHIVSTRSATGRHGSGLC